jgi:hypothetical protein
MKVCVALMGVVILFSGCQKILDYYKPGKTDSAKGCRIKSYSYNYYGDFYQTTFQYDAQGKPTLITYYDPYLSGGMTTEIFEYDSLNRLVNHLPDPFKGSSRVYVYEGTAKTPVRDTATDFSGNVYLETFETDDAGRIIQEKIELIKSEETPEPGFEFKTEVHRYYYDLHGNRQDNPFGHPWHTTLKYSDKPSLYSLNPVWQLISRDYSRNGVPNVENYTEQGLPRTFIFSEFAYWQPFLDLNLFCTIVYDCEN